MNPFSLLTTDFFFFQAEDGIRDPLVTGVQTCALPICKRPTLGSAPATIVFTSGELINDLATRRASSSLSASRDRKSTRLNSSHEWISYAVFCLKKKKKKTQNLHPDCP